MARDNPSWDAERIRGELLKLGIAVSRRSVRRHRRGAPACPPSQQWRTFLANHRPRIWAADLLTVQILTCRTLCVLLLVAHGRPELIHVNVTSSPTAAWIWQQLIGATPRRRVPRCLLRDRGVVYGRDVAARARPLGIQTVLTPVRAPRADAIAERLVDTLRRECLDDLIVFNEARLRWLLAEFMRSYNTERPHRTLDLDTPIQRIGPPRTGLARIGPLAGLYHTFERAA
jgi:transposase InsO family protein